MITVARNNNTGVFTLLPDGQPRWRSFSAGFGLEFLALTALIVLPMLMPQKLEVARRYWITPIEAPPIVDWKPQPHQPPKPATVKREFVKEVPKPEEIPVPQKPKIMAPVFTSPVVKPATARRNPDAPAVVTKVFPNQASMSLGSSATPTLRKPREAVQTGGFGDPNGVPANGVTTRSPNIAQLGRYDLPSGPGYGNGTGGARGARGVVPSAGFGNGVAIGNSNGSAHGPVQQGMFADESATTAAPKVKMTAATTPKLQPVEILFKPRPAYTDEARAKKIEGEVLLEVVFSASGEVRVLRVVKGLGYGLEESAESAARQIRFRPARQLDNRPIDSTAIVHIVFQLAY